MRATNLPYSLLCATGVPGRPVLCPSMSRLQAIHTSSAPYLRTVRALTASRWRTRPKPVSQARGSPMQAASTYPSACPVRRLRLVSPDASKTIACLTSSRRPILGATDRRAARETGHPRARLPRSAERCNMGFPAKRRSPAAKRTSPLLHIRGEELRRGARRPIRYSRREDTIGQRNCKRRRFMCRCCRHTRKQTRGMSGIYNQGHADVV